MFKIKNLINNENVKTLEKKGNMRIIEYVNDLSVSPSSAVTSYFAHKMNVRKRQVLILDKPPHNHYNYMVVN